MLRSLLLPKKKAYCTKTRSQRRSRPGEGHYRCVRNEPSLPLLERSDLPNPGLPFAAGLPISFVRTLVCFVSDWCRVCVWRWFFCVAVLCFVSVLFFVEVATSSPFSMLLFLLLMLLLLLLLVVVVVVVVVVVGLVVVPVWCVCCVSCNCLFWLGVPVGLLSIRMLGV